MELLKEDKIIKDIPVLTCKIDNNLNKPLVIISHGFTGSKQQFEENGYLKTLAEMGYYAVALDNRLHGSRPGPNFQSTVINQNGKVNLLLLRKAMKDTADDIKVLVDEFSRENDIDKDRIAMIGVSMGGFITFRSIVIDERIKVGIPIISSPYWDDIPGDVPTLTDDGSIKLELETYAQEYQPSVCIDKFYPRSILMQIGDSDKHYDKEKVKDFYNKLKQFYGDHQERLKLIIYPDTKHELKEEMWNQAIQWLKSQFYYDKG